MCRIGRAFPAFLAVLAATIAVLWQPSTGSARQVGDDAPSRVRVVHGISAAGPLDVYVDGSLALFGIVFPEASAEIVLSGGEHDVAVVPSGAGVDAAIAAGRVTLDPGAGSYVTLVGTADVASVGLFTIDERPLEAGRARFRVINGVADAGEIVPAFSGGEAISNALAFGEASEYAAIEAGAYDLDLLDAASGTPLLTLPQVAMLEGTATDIILVGSVSEATLEAVVAGTSVELTRPTGSIASVVPGRCGELNEPAVELGLVQPGQDEPVGIADAPVMGQGYALAPIPFATLIGEPHAIVVSGGEEGEGPVACGDIGGRLTENGALVIALEDTGQDGLSGIAVLAPALEDPATTGVSVFLRTAVGLPEASASPVPAGGWATEQAYPPNAPGHWPALLLRP